MREKNATAVIEVRTFDGAVKVFGRSKRCEVTRAAGRALTLPSGTRDRETGNERGVCW